VDLSLSCTPGPFPAAQPPPQLALALGLHRRSRRRRLSDAMSGASAWRAFQGVQVAARGRAVTTCGRAAFPGPAMSCHAPSIAAALRWRAHTPQQCPTAAAARRLPRRVRRAGLAVRQTGEEASQGAGSWSGIAGKGGRLLPLLGEAARRLPISPPPLPDQTACSALLLQTMKFPPEFSTKVDLTKVSYWALVCFLWERTCKASKLAWSAGPCTCDMQPAPAPKRRSTGTP